MPKVHLGFTPVRQAEVISKIIRKAMVDCDIPDLTTLADRLHMSRQTLSRKLNEGGWKETEIASVVRVLKIGPEGLLAMFGQTLPRDVA